MQNRQVTNDACTSLASLSALKHLNISGTSITLENLVSLVSGMVGLEALAAYGLKGSRTQVTTYFPVLQCVGLPERTSTSRYWHVKRH